MTIYFENVYTRLIVTITFITV